MQFSSRYSEGLSFRWFVILNIPLRLVILNIPLRLVILNIPIRLVIFKLGLGLGFRITNLMHALFENNKPSE